MNPDSPGLITRTATGTGQTLHLRGEVDAEVVGRFIRSVGDEAPLVEAIDARDVTFIDTTGVALMLRCQRRAMGAGLATVPLRASEPVDRMLRLVGVRDLFAALP